MPSLAFTPLFTNGTTTGDELNGNLAANRRAISGTIGGLTLLAGQSFGFRWADANSTGSDQGLGVDDPTITNASAVVGAVPEPATWAMLMLGFGAIEYSMRRRGKGSVGLSYAA